MVSAPCQAGDLSAKRMRALHAAHAKAVYHLLLRLTHGDRPAAEDLARETMLRAWRHIDGLETDDPDPERMRRWLYTLARRVAIDAARARPAEAGTDDPVERTVRARAVRKALAELSPDHRRVLIELYFRARSADETAELLGVPPGTLGSRTHHALLSLRAAGQ